MLTSKVHQILDLVLIVDSCDVLLEVVTVFEDPVAVLANLGAVLVALVSQMAHQGALVFVFFVAIGATQT